MHLKNGWEDAYESIFKFTDDISVFQSRISYDSFINQFIEYSGNEAETLCNSFSHLRCKSKFHTYSSPSNSCMNKNHLPQSFFREFDDSTKRFKELFFGKYLTQQFFEQDPVVTEKLCHNWYITNSTSNKINYCFPEVSFLSDLRFSYEETIALLKKIEEKKKEGCFCSINTKHLQLVT